MDMLSSLLIFYALFLAFNCLVASYLAIKSKSILHRFLALLWIMASVNFVLHGIFVNANTLITSYLSAIGVFEGVIVMRLISDLSDLKFKYWPYILFQALMCALATVIFFNFSQSFWAVLLPTSLGVAAPFFYAPLVFMRKKWHQASMSVKGFAVSSLLLAIHQLDYPFLRHNLSIVPFGYGIAILIIFALSLFVFIAIADKLDGEKQAALNQYTQAQKTLSLVSVLNHYNHELKTPWAVLYQYATDWDNVLDTSSENLKAVIREQFHRSEDIISTMVQILNSQRHRRVEAVDLNSLIQSSLKIYPVRVPHLALNLATIPTILGNTQDLQILVTNLLKNAQEALDKGLENRVRIETSVDESAAKVYLEIEDNGAGIPQDKVPSTWSGTQSKLATDTVPKPGSTGVGLMVVERIVEEHEGTVTVESVVNEFTLFRLSFPVNKPS